MHRRVDGEREADLAHPAGHLALLGVGALVVGDAVGVGRLHILDRELHVIEAARGELLEPRAGEQHAGRDEVGVEADLGGGGDDLLQVAPHRRLAAGKVQLQRRRGAPPGAARPATSPCRARRRRPPAPAGSSSRGIAAGSDASARRAARSGRADRPRHPCCLTVRAPFRSRNHHSLTGHSLQQGDRISCNLLDCNIVRGGNSISMSITACLQAQYREICQAEIVGVKTRSGARPHPRCAQHGGTAIFGEPAQGANCRCVGWRNSK